MALELFANNPITSVTSGGATAPASGTNENWAVSSPDNFPSASSSASPPTQFHISDPAAPSEIMAVINVSGTTWTVTRGAEGTTPVNHSFGFDVEQVVSAGALTQFITPATALGGDLSGNLPDPTVAQLNGLPVAVSPNNTTTYLRADGTWVLPPFASPNSPAFTGSPTAPTQTTGDSSTKIATDAFVSTAVTTAVATETTRATTAEALLAPKASPSFTGTPSAPTASVGTNTTQVATTAFVNTAMPMLNVRDFGAVCDGTTDDHAAFQSAVTAASAAGGGTVFMGPGSSFIGSRVTPASNVKIQGAGKNATTLISGVANDYVFYSSNSGSGIQDFHVSDLTINVNNVTHGAALRLEYATRCTIERVHFLNVPASGWGAVIGGPGSNTTYLNTDIKFKDCFFDTQASTLEMLLIMNTQHIEITGCDFYNNTSSNGPGIGLYQVVDDVKIIGCTFRSIAGPAVYYSLSTNNIVIDDCSFYGTTASTSVGVQGANLSDNGSFGAGWVYGLSITNCLFTGLGAGVQLGAVKGAVLDNCNFDSNYNIGVIVNGGSGGVNATPLFWVISNCKFRNNNKQATNALIHPGILLQNIGGSQYGEITNCAFWDDGAGGVHTQTCPITFSGNLTWDYINITQCYLENHQVGTPWQAIFTSGTVVLGPHVALSDCRLSTGSTFVAIAAEQGLASTGVQTASLSANPGNFIPVDASSGTVTVTLPTAPLNNTRIGVKLVNTSGSNTVSIAAGGADVFNKAGGPATTSLTTVNQGATLRYDATAAIWYAGSDNPVSTPGTLLASHSYGPGSEHTYNCTSTLAIMDGTNLTLSFVVPASGNVDIVVSADFAFAGTSSLSSATDMFMGIVAHGAVGTIYGLKSWAGSSLPSFVFGANDTHRYNLTGLTPGPLQIDLAVGLSSVTNISFASFYAVALGGALSTNPGNPIFIQAFAA